MNYEIPSNSFIISLWFVWRPGMGSHRCCSSSFSGEGTPISFCTFFSDIFRYFTALFLCRFHRIFFSVFSVPSQHRQKRARQKKSIIKFLPLSPLFFCLCIHHRTLHRFASWAFINSIFKYIFQFAEIQKNIYIYKEKNEFIPSPILFFLSVSLSCLRQ